MLTKKEAKRYEQLEKEATDRFLDRSDFSIVEWIDEDDRDEYYELYRKDSGMCLKHTEQECECFEKDKVDDKLREIRKKCQKN